MSDVTLVLDFNDAQLRFIDDSGELAASPGYAAFHRDTLLLGEEAARHARFDPRHTYAQFWEHLDQQPLNRAAGKARSHADIAFFHLQALWRAANTEVPVILSVPAQYGVERLAMLLGVVQACGIPLAGVVESAVAANTALAGTGQRQYYDITLHRLYASRIGVGDSVSLESNRELEKQGLVWCTEQWIRQIAAQFLAETRFDPLHDASSEQRLFDRIPQWLDELGGREHVVLELPAGLRQHRIEVSRETFFEAIRPLYQRLLGAADQGRIVLSHRLGRLPGLCENLRAHADVTVLPDLAVGRAALYFCEEISSDPAAPAWVTELSGALPSADAATLQPEATTPTHLLHHHRAWALGERPLLLSAPPRSLAPGDSAHGCLVRRASPSPVLDVPVGFSGKLRRNGQPLEPGQYPLHLGDRLQLGEADYRLIALDGGS